METTAVARTTWGGKGAVLMCSVRVIFNRKVKVSSPLSIGVF